MFWMFKTGVHAALFKTACLGNGIMGASFQAPHAAPRQRQMETHHVH